jgi:hypothetical protein
MAKLPTPITLGTVFPGFDPATKQVRHSKDLIHVRDARLTESRSYRFRVIPPAWVDFPEMHHPAWWHCFSDWIDADNKNCYSFTTLVTNDFGDLVEVTC